MSKVEMIGAKVALPVSGGAMAWPFVMPPPDEYASILNLYVIPTLGALAALFVLLIKVRIWWRGSRWSSYAKDESGAVSKRAMAAMLAGIVAVGLPMTALWEGKENAAYWDKYGQVWTVCYGETKGVGQGDIYTDAQCTQMLEGRWVEFYAGMKSCAPQMTDAPIEVQAAVTSWAYNVGTGAACKSTLARHLRDRDWRAACNQLPRWRRAGGQVLQGLINRRADERVLCLSGLKS